MLERKGAIKLSVFGFAKCKIGSIVRSKERLDIRDACIYTKRNIAGPVRNNPLLAKASSFRRFLYHTQRRTTVGTTPLDE